MQNLRYLFQNILVFSGVHRYLQYQKLSLNQGIPHKQKFPKS